LLRKKTIGSKNKVQGKSSIMSAMNTSHPLAGVYAAAVTPLRPDFSLDLDSLPGLLAFFARRGCHGALLLGTTGEGPSFSPRERLALFKAALAVRQKHPDFRLLAGTGTPSLDETAELTRAALELGFDGAVVLPPYYFRKVSDEGLFAWFSQVIQRAVPEGSYLLGYHFPGVSGVGLSLELLTRLKEAYPGRFAGLKDSSADPELASRLGKRFGGELAVLNGTDRLFSYALERNAAGCITALANLLSPDLRQVWDFHQNGSPDPQAQQAADQAQRRLNQGREVVERYPPAAPLLKALLAHLHDFPRWAVRPPILPLPAGVEEQAAAEMKAVYAP
jgi:4-hydroxy-tetrahydrodipicolinate synthase